MPRTKEIRIAHKQIRDPNTITQVQEKAFQDAGLDMHRDELTGEHDGLIDDHDRGVRVLRVKGRTKYFFIGK